MPRDPFSDGLRFMRASSVRSHGLIAGGAWAIQSPVPDKLKFWGVVRGRCWLRFEGKKTAIRIEAGDMFMVSAPRRFVLASDLAAPVVSLAKVLHETPGAVGRFGRGSDFYMIGGQVALEPDAEPLLVQALPPFIHIRAASSRAATLQWLMRELVEERDADAPGADVASTQLTHLMFIHILRAHFEAGGAVAAGWLRAVSDKRLAPALRLMHGAPGRPWQLGELARAASMSRATFAAYFKETAGVAPIAYLTQWRMRLAARALHEDGASIAELARELGYASESAFSHAFKRVTGRSPSSVAAAASRPSPASASSASRRRPPHARP